MRIAVAQTPGTRLSDWRKTLALIEDALTRAAQLKADLLLLPECVWPTYALPSRQAYFDARRAGLPDNKTFLDQVSHAAQTRRVAVCAGYVEEAHDCLTNAACLIDATGKTLGVHRKCFLWDFDHDCFEPGRRIQPVDTDFGRIGLMVCADARLPEIPATLAARGAALILQPTGWVNGGTPDRLWNAQPDFLIPARAREFGIPIASASKWGVEGQATFVGSSLICDAAGNVLVQCGQRETVVVAADVEPAPPRPPSVTPSQRELLLGGQTPRRPAADVTPLRVVPLPPAPARTRLDQRLHQAAPQPRDHNILYVGAPPTPDEIGPSLLRIGNQLCLIGPTSELFDSGGASIATTTAADATGFAPIRCLALCGVHLVVVFGDEVAPELIRARACENRVFVAWVRTDGLALVDPRGQVLAEEPWPSDFSERSGVTLDLRLASDKEVTRRTDVFAGRRPSQYQL